MLSQEDLEQITAMCHLPQCPDVVTVAHISQSQKHKLVRFRNNAYLVLYKKKEVVTVLSELPIDAFPKPPKPTHNKSKHRNHTKYRLKQRFQIEASTSDIDQMAVMCRTKYQHIKISERDPGRTKNLIHYKDTDIVAIYEDCSDSIVTVMPPSYLKKTEHDWLFCSKRVRYRQLLKHTKEQHNVTR